VPDREQLVVVVGELSQQRSDRDEDPASDPDHSGPYVEHLEDGVPLRVRREDDEDHDERDSDGGGDVNRRAAARVRGCRSNLLY
jgi:hypothetical protein